MNDEFVNLPDLTSQQKRSIDVSKVIFWFAIASFVFLGALTCFYGITCPTAADVMSGHTYPFFDKIYGRYVYVTEIEKDVLDVLVCFGGACICAYVAIDLDLKRQFRSARKNGSM
jgi:hypothetical protein